MPAAGMPWFVAVFGDSIIASLQAMAVSYEFGRGTWLSWLSCRQLK